MSNSITSAAGEHHVLCQLMRRDWIASLAPANAQNVDILCTDKNSKKHCSIQVKTRRGRFTKSSGWIMNEKHETIIADALFYVFVDLGKPTDPINSYCRQGLLRTTSVVTTEPGWLLPADMDSLTMPPRRESSNQTVPTLSRLSRTPRPSLTSIHPVG